MVGKRFLSVLLFFCVLVQATVSDNSTADELYQKAIDSTQQQDYGNALAYAERALDAYSEVGDNASVEKCQEIIRGIRGPPIIVDYEARASYFHEKGVDKYSTANCTNGNFIEALKSFENAQISYISLKDDVNAQEEQAWIKKTNMSLLNCDLTASTTTTVLEPSLVHSMASSSTTVAQSKSGSPSGSQILLVAGAVVVLSVVGFMFLRHRK